MKRNIKSHKGFTLVEMLGVLAIIAILISVISVGVLSAINRARIVSAISNFKNIETATLAYVALNESSGKVPFTKNAGGIPTVTNLTNTAADGTALAAGAQNSLHLEIVYQAAGTLEKYPTWRVGTDALQNGLVLADERGWNRKKNKWAEVNTDGVTAASNQSWATYCRTECAPVAPAATDPGILTDIANGQMVAAGVNFRTDGVTPLVAGSRVVYVVLPGLTIKDAEKLSEEINGSLNDMDIRNGTIKQNRGRFVTTGAETAVLAGGGIVGFYLIEAF
jgi:prepilin-type N-terminal cleavage/methylation domain-containing protein